jgi:hypothetical protein
MGAVRARMETQWAQENLARQPLLEVGALRECEACDVVVDELAADEISEEAIALRNGARQARARDLRESSGSGRAVRRVLDNSALDCRCAQDRD